MMAVYGNLMVMGIAAALFYATINLGKKRNAQAEAEGRPVSTDPVTEP